MKDQARIPLLASNEMANAGPAKVVAVLRSTMASKGAADQVIVGSGGSPFDDKLSGNVSLNLYGFGDDFGPTQLLHKYSVESLQ